MAARKQLVVGNWKMNGNLAANSVLLRELSRAVSGLKHPDVAVCVPFPYLAQAEKELRGSGIEWGAQDISEHDAGAYTGDVSGQMLKDFACRYVIVGHSERRQFHAESDEVVAAKFAAAVRQDLVPILCLGETLAERDRGEAEAVVARQLNSVVLKAGAETLSRSVLAYEPVWAIGTGKTASSEQAQAMHAFLRAQLAGLSSSVAAVVPILYGGSVKPTNAAELFSQPDIDGGLIGGASLSATDFFSICGAAARR